jgi:hypothetical protein
MNRERTLFLVLPAVQTTEIRRQVRHEALELQNTWIHKHRFWRLRMLGKPLYKKQYCTILSKRQNKSSENTTMYLVHRSATCFDKIWSSLLWRQKRKDKSVHICIGIEISMPYICYYIKLYI